MSFVKKAVKKVFDFAKRVVKSKVFKWVAVAALTFFTAGVAAGGFASFAGVNSIGSFFTAVGQTMATGASAIANMVGLKGVSGTLAQRGGASAIQAGLTSSATSATGAAIAADAASGTIGGLLTKGGEAVALSSKAAELAIANAGASAFAEAGLSGIAGTNIVPGNVASLTGTQVEGAMKILTTTAAKSSGVSSAVWGAVSSGATSALKAFLTKDANKRGPTFVAGGLSHGGSAELGPQPRFVVGGSNPLRTDPIDGRAPSQETTPPISSGDIGPTQAGLLAQQAPGGHSQGPAQLGEGDPSGALDGAVGEPQAPLGAFVGTPAAANTPAGQLQVPFQSTPIETRRRRRGGPFSAPILGVS